jgi:DNA-binding CsgD family transcriptional regulator
MSKSKSLTNRQVQLAVRTAWEAAELRRNPVAQGEHLTDQLCDMVGCDFGFWCTINDFVPDAMPKVTFAAVGSVKPADLLEYFNRTGRDFSPLEDPAMDLGRYVGQRDVLLMSEMLQKVEPATHSNAIEIMQKIGTRDAVVGIHRRQDPRSINALSVHRATIRRRHNERERALVAILMDELEYLYNTGRLAPQPDPLRGLSPRLRQIAQQLMTDRSAKQIARELKLTTETTRYYIKQLYRRTGVSSRPELTAKLRCV